MNGKPWTKEHDEYLKMYFPGNDTRKICRILHRSIAAVYGRAQKLGLHKTEEAKRRYGGYLTGQEGYSHRFPKGHIPANKGKRMPREQYEKCRGTMFKKGQIPKNHKPVGTISIRTNSTKKESYLHIKIAEPNKWELLHRYVWIREHGPIPRGMNVAFKDGNAGNCTLDNLELITRAETMRRNTIHNRYPQELKEAIYTLGRLKRKIREHEERN